MRMSDLRALTLLLDFLGRDALACFGEIVSLLQAGEVERKSDDWQSKMNKAIGKLAETIHAKDPKPPGRFGELHLGWEPGPEMRILALVKDGHDDYEMYVEPTAVWFRNVGRGSAVRFSVYVLMCLAQGIGIDIDPANLKPTKDFDPGPETGGTGRN